MTKFYDDIAFSTSYEDENHPGKWVESMRVEKYYGDVTKMYKRAEGSKVIDDIKINNQISILADPFAFENFHNIKYVKWMGVKWKVDSVDVQYPRLILSIGGIFNE